MTVTAEAPHSTTPATPAPPSSWRRALAIALGVNTALCVFLIFLVGEVIPPVLVFGVLFAVLAALTMRVRRGWPQWVAVVLGLLFIGGNMPFIIEDLSHPDSIAGFAPIWLMTITTVFVIVGAVMVLRKPTGGTRMVASVFATVAIIGVAGSAVATAGVSDDTKQEGDAVLVAEDVEYPEEFVVAEEAEAIFVENHDAFRHTFVVDGQDVKHELPGNADRRVALDLEPGTYTFRCDVPGHETMQGTLIVE